MQTNYIAKVHGLLLSFGFLCTYEALELKVKGLAKMSAGEMADHIMATCEDLV